MNDELRKPIKWDRPCYKCKSYYCDLSCPEPVKNYNAAPQRDLVDRAWNRFNKAISDGPDSPYPGMATAFETHYGQSWTDKDWRTETSVWAAAWKAALSKNANAAPQDDPKSVDCERCGLTPELHTPTHWCDNQSFQVAAPEPQPQRKEYMVRDLTGAEIYKLWREHQTSSISTFVRR